MYSYQPLGPNPKPEVQAQTNSPVKKDGALAAASGSQRVFQTQCFDGKLLVQDLSRSTLVFLIMVVMCACGLPCILVSCTEMLDSC